MHKIPAFAEKHAKAGFFLKTAAPSHGEFLCENTCPAADLFSVFRVCIDSMFAFENTEFIGVYIVACVDIAAPGARFR